MLPALNLPVAIDDVVEERGGPWEAVELSAARFPGLQTALPLQIVYKRAGGEWTPHLLIAESCILRRVNARGVGVYALRRFRGPREVNSALGGRREAGDEIGWFGGAIVGAAPKLELKRMSVRAHLYVKGAKLCLQCELQGGVGLACCRWE